MLNSQQQTPRIDGNIVQQEVKKNQISHKLILETVFRQFQIIEE
jgi:hypothetical protein